MKNQNISFNFIFVSLFLGHRADNMINLNAYYYLKLTHVILEIYSWQTIMNNIF